MELYEHQKEALQQTEGFPNVAVYYDMGLGKTFIGSECMKRFNTKVNIVVCQKSKVNDWQGHMIKHYLGDYVIWDLTDKRELEEFYRCIKLNIETIGIINYDLIWRRPKLKQLKDFTLMLDESSLIQNMSSKRTKFIMKMNPNHVILLSGTPVGGKYENLYSQIKLLGWNISEKLYQNQYINWTLIEAGGVKHKIVDMSNPYKNVERLKAKMRQYGAVFKKTEECFSLPEQTFIKHFVKPTREYIRFKRDCIVNFNDTDLVGDTKLTKQLYERQLCGQYNLDKIEATKDLIESTNERIIIFYSFNDELQHLKNICSELNKPVSEVNGHVKNLDAYNTHSDSVTLCQYQSASKGLNLQLCHQIVYFTLPTSSEDYEQSKKRIHRIGTEQTCFYHLMLCKNSIEEQILKRLEMRKDYTDELFED